MARAMSARVMEPEAVSSHSFCTHKQTVSEPGAHPGDRGVLTQGVRGGPFLEGVPLPPTPGGGGDEDGSRSR